MNDRQLRSFISSAELKSFSKAAAESFISTPALVNQINSLEKDLGFSLFDRNTHGIELTREGETFLESARRILQIYDEAIEHCKSNTEDMVLEVAAHSMNMSDIADFIFMFQEEHPEITVRFLDVEETKAVNNLEDDSLQVHYCPEPLSIDTDRFQFIATDARNYTVCVRKGHALARLNLVSKEDLQKYTVYTYDWPKFKVNPLETLRRFDIKAEVLENDLSQMDFMNRILADQVILLPSAAPSGRENFFVKLKTDISCGRYGFLIKKDPDDLTKQFIDEYLAK